jgi:AcrR family transcriptional regulator
MLVKTNGGFMIKRKDRIIISALELLEEGGINNVTTKNLARKQNISEPALYRQFKNKHDIVVAMIEEYANYDEKIMNTIREHEMKGKDAIVYYVTRYGELYQSYSEISVILYSLDLYFYEDDTRVDN